jgi:hypothetical protein
LITALQLLACLRIAVDTTFTVLSKPLLFRTKCRWAAHSQLKRGVLAVAVWKIFMPMIKVVEQAVTQGREFPSQAWDRFFR